MSGQTIISFKLEGFDELKTELYKLSKHFQRKGADTMANAGAEVVRNAAREIARSEPVRSKYPTYFSHISEEAGEYSGMTIKGRSFRRNKAGELTGSMVRKEFQAGWISQNIFMGRSKNKKLLRYGSYWRVFVPSQAWFARFVEYGFTLRGRKYPAHSFIRRAVKENIWKIIGAMQERLFDFLTKQNFKRLKVTRGW